MPTANVSLEETESMYFQSWQLTSAFVHPTAHGGDVGLCVLMDCLLILHPNKDQSGIPAETPPTSHKGQKGCLLKLRKFNHKFGACGNIDLQSFSYLHRHSGFNYTWASYTYSTTTPTVLHYLLHDYTYCCFTFVSCWLLIFHFVYVFSNFLKRTVHHLRLKVKLKLHCQ